ncbi:MAG: NADH-quinone oxidoreductase subunit N [Chloroflexi bacterium]|nr:NADH-quinone oxidoreductase subunit N [Chloroflexota bacterium]MCI0790502.1 NADH-quinone oxidoreductase subunit N [Chloroflexota bacterium]MCI0795266.1 NADH-quinone oxidoreductase subunit N [Chloroflexota bacterium]MCI0812368.1 NADH-quinone oxidoreductase subunit N [Chloroflexota bacterium]MCI0841344.1 NADH-quinone oxidoreductase subunit N [Chloroflexota bacterium]
MSNNFLLLLPEFLVTGLAFLVLTLDFFTSRERKTILPFVALVGLGAILVFSLVYLWNRDEVLYGGLLRIDGYALFFKAFFLVLGGFIVLMSYDYVKRNLEYPGEYYGILLFTVVAMMLMASSGELLTAYMALELLSFGLYVLVGYDRYNAKSNEGATKYILLGAFSSALLLYGISQIYGLLGTTRFDEINAALAATGDLSPGVMLGIVLIIAGLGFKIAAVPFHMWAPDAYEGAPIPVTAYLAVGSKAAAFALVLRLFTEAFLPSVGDWQMLLVIMAVATMLLGNLVALVQTNMKRLLAYSSIGQVGYLLMGVAALAVVEGDGGVSIELSRLVSNGIMLHLVAYAVTNMAVFMCLAAIYNVTGRDDIAGMAGVARRAPLLGLVMAVSLFSLAGLPIFAGFTSKFYLFNAVAASGMLWLAGLAIFASLISLYYYLTIVRQLYIEPAEDPTPIFVPRLTSISLGVLLVGIVFIGVYPAPLMEAIQYASDVLLSAEPVTQGAAAALVP